jgi:ATP-dependent DNA helicase RecG
LPSICVSVSAVASCTQSVVANKQRQKFLRHNFFDNQVLIPYGGAFLRFFIKQSHHSYPQNPTIADVLFKTTFLENWGSGVGRMIDACQEANLPEPEFNQNAAFV